MARVGPQRHRKNKKKIKNNNQRCSKYSRVKIFAKGTGRGNSETIIHLETRTMQNWQLTPVAGTRICSKSELISGF